MGKQSAVEKEEAGTVIEVPARQIVLKRGERWLGTMLKEDGTPDYDLILIAVKEDEASWDDAMAWAKEMGGDLPSPREQHLQGANAEDQFNDGWYWSNAQHESFSSRAWAQYFGDGYQHGFRKSFRLAACAVRRSFIQ